MACPVKPKDPCRDCGMRGELRIENISDDLETEQRIGYLNYQDGNCGKNEIVPCPTCLRPVNQWQMKDHVGECAAREYKCELCCKTFKSSALLDEHVYYKECAELQPQQPIDKFFGDGLDEERPFPREQEANEESLIQDVTTLTKHQQENVYELRRAIDAINRQLEYMNLDKPSAYDGKLLEKIDQDIRAQTRLIQLCEKGLQEYEQPTYDGKFVWAINNYEEKKRAEEQGRIVRQTSNCFYTSSCGYKLQAHAFLNGTGSFVGKGISIFVEILEGENNDLLTFPFNLDVGFMLMSQKRNPNREEWVLTEVNNSECYSQRPPKNMGLSFGSEKFALHRDIETNEFLENNRIFIKIKVARGPCRNQLYRFSTNFANDLDNIVEAPKDKSDETLYRDSMDGENFGTKEDENQQQPDAPENIFAKPDSSASVNNETPDPPMATEQPVNQTDAPADQPVQKAPSVEQTEDVPLPMATEPPAGKADAPAEQPAQKAPSVEKTEEAPPPMAAEQPADQADAPAEQPVKKALSVEKTEDALPPMAAAQPADQADALAEQPVQKAPSAEKTEDAPPPTAAEQPADQADALAEQPAQKAPSAEKTEEAPPMATKQPSNEAAAPAEQLAQKTPSAEKTEEAPPMATKQPSNEAAAPAEQLAQKTPSAEKTEEAPPMATKQPSNEAAAPAEQPAQKAPSAEKTEDAPPPTATEQSADQADAPAEQPAQKAPSAEKTEDAPLPTATEQPADQTDAPVEQPAQKAPSAEKTEDAPPDSADVPPGSNRGSNLDTSPKVDALSDEKENSLEAAKSQDDPAPAESKPSKGSAEKLQTASLDENEPSKDADPSQEPPAESIAADGT